MKSSKGGQRAKRKKSQKTGDVRQTGEGIWPRRGKTGERAYGNVVVCFFPRTTVPRHQPLSRRQGGQIHSAAEKPEGRKKKKMGGCARKKKKVSKAQQKDA